jgi:hypothetical protein
VLDAKQKPALLLVPVKVDETFPAVEALQIAERAVSTPAPGLAATGARRCEQK